MVGTPIPKRDVELRSRGNGPVITYKLSEEELQILREKERGKMSVQPQTKAKVVSGPSRSEFLRMVAAGKRISAIEREWNMTQGSLSYWVRKWNLKGISKEQAQDLLAEIQIDGVKQEQTEAAAAVESRANNSPAENGSLNQEVEIEKLRLELHNAKQTIADLHEDVRNWRQQAEDLKVHLASRDQDYCRLQNENSELTNELTAKEYELTELLKQNEILQAKVDSSAVVSDFEQIGREIGALVAEKNAAYGDSFAKSGAFLRLLYPNGIQPEQYVDSLCVVRIFDKLMRIATRKDAFGESPYKDIIGYGILGVRMDKEVSSHVS